MKMVTLEEEKALRTAIQLCADRYDLKLELSENLTIAPLLSFFAG